MSEAIILNSITDTPTVFSNLSIRKIELDRCTTLPGTKKNTDTPKKVYTYNDKRRHREAKSVLFKIRLRPDSNCCLDRKIDILGLDNICRLPRARIDYEQIKRVLPIKVIPPKDTFRYCQDVVTLSATLEYGNLNDHTIRWEQIHGEPVIFISGQDELNLVINRGVNKDDKMFRLFVDKGRATEESYDVFLSGTPYATLSGASRHNSVVELIDEVYGRSTEDKFKPHPKRIEGSYSMLDKEHNHEEDMRPIYIYLPSMQVGDPATSRLIPSISDGDTGLMMQIKKKFNIDLKLFDGKVIHSIPDVSIEQFTGTPYKYYKMVGSSDMTDRDIKLYLIESLYAKGTNIVYSTLHYLTDLKMPSIGVSAIDRVDGLKDKATVESSRYSINNKIIFPSKTLMSDEYTISRDPSRQGSQEVSKYKQLIVERIQGNPATRISSFALESSMYTVNSILIKYDKQDTIGG